MPKRLLLLAAAIASSASVAGCGDPPDAEFTVSPGPHLTGDTVTFTRNQKCGLGARVELAWDLNGDGMFEDAPSSCRDYPDSRHIYTRPGTYTATLDASYTDYILGIFHLVHGYSSQRVVVEARPVPAPPGGEPAPGQPAPNQAPTADFSSDANPGYTERAVRFDAGASKDPDGQIVKYEWDFDSDGTWDSTGPTATHAYQASGTYKATLRVTDDDGASGTTERAVPIVDGVPPEESSADSGLTAARSGTPFSTTLSGKLTAQGRRFINGGTLSSIGLTARGSMKLKGLPEPLQKKRKARWATILTTKQRGSDDKAKLAAEGFLLLDFGRGDRVCFSGRIAGTLADPFSGRLGVVGGSGLGLRLRGGASLVVPLTGKTVSGKLNLARTKQARRLPKACRTAARVLR